MIINRVIYCTKSIKDEPINIIINNKVCEVNVITSLNSKFYLYIYKIVIKFWIATDVIIIYWNIISE